MNTSTIITLAQKQNEQAKRTSIASDVVQARANHIAPLIGYAIDDAKQGITPQMARENIAIGAGFAVKAVYDKAVKATGKAKKAQEKRVFSKKTVNVAAESVTITKSHTFDQKVELIMSLCNADKKLLGAVLVKLGKKG